MQLDESNIHCTMIWKTKLKHEREKKTGAKMFDKGSRSVGAKQKSTAKMTTSDIFIDDPIKSLPHPLEKFRIQVYIFLYFSKILNSSIN